MNVAAAAAATTSGYRFLLIALVCLLAVYPLVSDLVLMQSLLDVFLLAILWGCVHASSVSRPVKLALISLAGVVVASGLFVDWTAHAGVYLVSAFAGLVFFASVTVLLVREVFLRMQRADAETVFTAINAYLLLGLTFAFAYMVIDVLVPGSFDHEQILMGDANERFESFVYFSYVTLTTLGFGDITPRSLEAGAFVYTEAMLGQLYLAVLVARLVGMYRSDTDAA